jgi:uncharacterized protein
MAFCNTYGPWALVTGASSGLGEHYARQLAERGLNVIVVARREERLRTLASDLEQEHGVRTLALAVDLLHPDAISHLRVGVGRRDVGLVVSNAGFGSSGPFLEQDLEMMSRMVRLNCELPVKLLHAFAPHLIERGCGGVIQLASTAAFQCTPWMAVYGATKAFDLHFAEGLMVELGPHGVDVLAVCPGHTLTEFHQVAGIHKAAFGGAAMPEDVVRESLRQLGKRLTYVHGTSNRLMVRSNRLVPRAVSAWAAGRILKKRLESQESGSE